VAKISEISSTYFHISGARSYSQIIIPFKINKISLCNRNGSFGANFGKI